MLGGRLSPERRDGFVLGAGFAFGDAGFWRAAADHLGLSSATLPVPEGRAMVYGTKGWGDAEDLPLWEEWLSRNCSEFPVGGMLGITETLLAYCQSQPNFSFSLETPVTEIHIEQGLARKVTLGSKKEIEPGEVYWCADYKGLLEVLKGEAVPAPGPERVSWLKKFVKSPSQPGVVLEFAHKNRLGDFTETLLLPFSATEKEKHYLVGAISSNRDPSLAPPGKSLSSWVLALSEEEWGDNHETMKKIRSARRLMEKAFPHFEQTLLFDRVLVLESTVSPLGKKKGERKGLLPNLHIGADWAMPMGATWEGVSAALLE